ncbi:hypothetical protein [Burkholderia orbicola]|uniref:HNH endonuclease n=1 Tax=Burkholderia orbicola TaxID=2978683 RepID=UPI002FE42A64
MSVIPWIDNDHEYTAWTHSHPNGFIANIYKEKNGKQSTRYLKIHSADHHLPNRSKPNTVNPWTGNKYAKVTSDNLDSLLSWLTSKGFEITPEKYCITCSLDKGEGGAPQSGESIVVFPDEIPPDQQPLIEGAVKQVLVNRYERDPRARAACIQHWDAVCYVCGFDFQKTYGDMGRGFIHVHHLTDIASIGTEYEVDPHTDLRPVCPNCHAMLHTQRPAMDIDDLKSKLTARRSD